jgi:two-component system cell cycle response regulator DivK
MQHESLGWDMGKKILIVDDNEKNLKVLRVVLQHSGYETIEATDGEQAIRLAKDILPDLILMDIRMPGMNGIEATRILKSEELTAKIPVVVVTSSAMRGDRERICSETWCDDFITKPIEIKPLLELVKKYVGD